MSSCWCRALLSGFPPSQRSLRVWLHNDFPGIRRLYGVRMFAHHEICTHGLRAVNERLQPWAVDRRRFDLCRLG